MDWLGECPSEPVKDWEVDWLVRESAGPSFPSLGWQNQAWLGALAPSPGSPQSLLSGPLAWKKLARGQGLCGDRAHDRSLDAGLSDEDGGHRGKVFAQHLQ